MAKTDDTRPYTGMRIIFGRHWSLWARKRTLTDKHEKNAYKIASGQVCVVVVVYCRREKK